MLDAWSYLVASKTFLIVRKLLQICEQCLLKRLKISVDAAKALVFVEEEQRMALKAHLPDTDA